MSRFVTYSVVGLMSLFGGLALAQSPEPIQVDIDAQPVGDALNQFAEQSGLQVVLYADDAKGIDVAGVSGQFDDATVALDSLLASTGLEYSFINDRTVAVASVQKVAEAGGDSDSGNGRTAGATQKAVMMAQASAEQSQASRRTETDSDEDEDERKRPLEEIVVTGTNIRGIAPESSPVHVYDREDIQISGAATAQDFIHLMPQNFGGGSNIDLPVGLPGDINSGFNTNIGGFGSSVNLRGLGSGSTLVLLNGHRVAPASGVGDFIDLSMIPASALERVEVLTDGASAIYGADAVAGVVNFVLRDDFDGAELSLRYGTVTEGDLDEFQTSITGGRNWDSGNALLTYEFFRQTNLKVEDRSFSKDAVTVPNDLLPWQERHSVLGHVSQEVTESLELYGDITFSSRNVEQNRTFISGLVTRRSPSTQNLNVSAGGGWRIFGSWAADFSGTYSKVQIDRETLSDVGDSITDINSELWSGDVRASGDVFALPGGIAKLAVGAHYRGEDFTSATIVGGTPERFAKRDVYALFGEAYVPLVGPENSIPGVNRLEVNVSGRFEDYSDFGSTANPKVGLLWSPFEEFRLRASYSTSFNPPALGHVGAVDTGVFAYSTLVINDLLGLTAGDPSIADVVAISVSGTADNLDAEESRTFSGGFDYDEQWGRHNLNLTASYFDIQFENRLGTTPVPDGRSGFDVPNIAFNSPELFPEGTVIFNPSVDQINQLVNSADRVSTLPSGLDPLDAAIVRFNSILHNLSATIVRGFDFGIAYSFDSDFGTLLLGLDGTLLRDFKQQGSVIGPFFEQLNTQFNPVDLRLRGHAGLVRDGFAANVFVNYTNDYGVDNTADAARIDSWSTVDISLSYDTRESMRNSIFADMVFRLSVSNLFDQEPPFAPGDPSLSIFGYDPTNASPLNRFLAFEVTRRF